MVYNGVWPFGQSTVVYICVWPYGQSTVMALNGIFLGFIAVYMLINFYNNVYIIASIH